MNLLQQVKDRLVVGNIIKEERIFHSTLEVEKGMWMHHLRECSVGTLNKMVKSFEEEEVRKEP